MSADKQALDGLKLDRSEETTGSSQRGRLKWVIVLLAVLKPV